MTDERLYNLNSAKDNFRRGNFDVEKRDSSEFVNGHN